MKNRILPLFLLTVIPGAVLAQDATNYQCTYGDLTRRVAIVSEPGLAVPCEVHYYKDSEAPGEPQVLWRALNEEGYCEAKSKEFRAKLTGWGWSCGAASDDAAMPVEPTDDSMDEMVDDTEALAPAKDDADG